MEKICWKDVFDALDDSIVKDYLSKSRLNHDRLKRDLTELMPIFPDRYLRSSQGPPLLRSAAESVTKRWVGHLPFFYDAVGKLASLIRAVRHIPGFDKLAEQLATHTYGYMNQLYATLWCSTFMRINEVEYDKLGTNVDIVASLSGVELYVHVKTIDQRDKTERQRDAVAHIWSILRELAEKGTGLRFAIIRFEGLVPTSFANTKDEWWKLLQRETLRPGTIILELDDENQVSIELIEVGETDNPAFELAGVTQFYRNLDDARDYARKKARIKPDGNTVLLGVVPWIPGAKGLKLGEDRQFLSETGIDIEVYTSFSLPGNRQHLSCERSGFFTTPAANPVGLLLSGAVSAEVKIPLAL